MQRFVYQANKLGGNWLACQSVFGKQAQAFWKKIVVFRKLFAKWQCF